LWGNANCPQPQKIAGFLICVFFLAFASVCWLVVQLAQVVFFEVVMYVGTLLLF